MVSFYALGTMSLVGFTGCVWIYMKTKIQEHERYKTTTCYKEALAALRAHKGAIKFLGQPIEDKKMYITNIENISNEIKQFEVNVEVKGPQHFGLLYFWVNQFIEDPSNFYVDAVQLQIGSDTKKRLVIKKSRYDDEQKNKTEEQKDDAVNKMEENTEKKE